MLNPTCSQPSSYFFFLSNPGALAVAQAKNYGIILDSSLSLSTFDSSLKAVGSTSKLYSHPDQFSSPPLLPFWSKTPLSTGLWDSIFALLLFISQSAARVIYLKHKSDLVISLLSALQWLPTSLKIKSSLTVDLTANFLSDFLSCTLPQLQQPP